MRKIIGAGIAVFAVAMLILVTQLGTGGVRANAVTTATIDFEGLAEGAIISNVSSGSGISGDPLTGSVTVFGSNPDIDGGATNTAVIFDATCTPFGNAADCTGEDPDLFQPAQGNVLIIAEDLVDTTPADGLVDDPDDALTGQFQFDFTGLDCASVTVNSFVYMDVEDAETTGAQVAFTTTGSPVNVDILPSTGDGGIDTLDVSVSNVLTMVVDLKGSGAIDDIIITCEPPNGGGEGCTPGFWKNNLDAWGPTTFNTGDLFEDETIFDRDAFNNPDDPSLLEVMNFRGGGLNRLSAHAVAALLNASHPDIDYDLSVSEVIAAWQSAFDDGSRSAMNAQKNIFVGFNESGCDFD